MLNAELTRAAQGEFRCVVLLGDAGIGKTRLAAEFIDNLADGAVGLSARAYPFGQTASFGLWSEAIERHLRRLAVHEVVELCGGFLDDLAGLLRSVAAARGAAPEVEAPTLRLMDGLASILANLALAGPVVVSFDDVHLADPSSWEALHYLAHTLSDTPMLVVASARPVELADHPLAREVIGALEQDGQLRRLVLPAVDRAGLAQLCHSVVQVPPPERLVEWVSERSQGNPLFALGLVRALIDEGGDLTAPRLHRLPETLAERVASRLTDLDPEALATAEVLAVLARPLPLEDLARLSECSLDEMAAAAHRLIRTRLIVLDDQEPESRYGLAHPLLQEVIYDRIGPFRRRALHRLAARSLAAAGRFGDAASHFARCAEVGESEAVNALRDALRQAEEREAYPEALEILATLVEVLPAEDERWSEIVHVFSTQAQWALDRRVEADASRGLRAMRVLDSVMERFPDLARRAAVKHRLGLFLGWGMADLSEAMRLVGEARDLFDAAGDRRSMVVCSGSAAYLHAYAGEWEAMQAEAERALAGAEALREPLLAGSALAALGRTAVVAGRFDEGCALIDRVIALARSENDPDRLAWALTVKAISWAFGGQLQEVGGLLAEIKSLSQVWRRGILVVFEPGIRWLAGDVPGARESAAQFVALHPDWLAARRGIGAVFGALVALEADDRAAAEDYLGRAARAYGDRSWSVWSFSLDHAAAVLAHRAGRPAEALGRLRRAAPAQRASGGSAFAALAFVDQAELASAPPLDAEAAREAADHLTQMAEEIDRGLFRGYAAFGQACAELAEGRPEAARPPAEAALAVFSSLGYRILEGRALVALGRSLAHVDQPAALKAFERAVTTFDHCGADWRRDQTRALMRSLGSRGRKLAGARLGPGALTRREREVAQLAIKGQTAREIAETLFVGERTVEGHLASVYAKLGISSKLDLARRASELGL